VLPPAANPVVGIDAGITALVTLSTGEKVENPKFEKQDRERLARAQRELMARAFSRCETDEAEGVVAVGGHMPGGLGDIVPPGESQ